MMPEPIPATPVPRTADQILARIDELYQELRTARGERKTAIEAQILAYSQQYRQFVPHVIAYRTGAHTKD